MTLDDACAVLTGGRSGDRAGSDIAAAGDHDGDGYRDLWVGAEGYYYTGTSGGRAYLALGPLTADMDLGSASAILEGQANYNAGRSVSGDGDANGDGWNDVLVGGPGFLTGVGWLFYGPVSGTHILTSDADLSMMGTATGDQLGTRVWLEGDLNGDGLADPLVVEPSEISRCSWPRWRTGSTSSTWATPTWASTPR